MKQFTKIYYDAADNILHIHTQDSPITFEPVENDERIVRLEDLEIDTPIYIKARDLLNNMEFRDGGIKLKSNARIELKDLAITKINV